MRANDVMSRPVLTVRDDDSMEQAAALLSHNNVTAAPVVDADGEVIGIVSEGDLLRARTALDQRTTAPAPAVTDVMTRDVVTLPPDSELSAVAETMLRHTVHSVPIVDGSGELLGIVCRHDLLRVLVRTDDVVQWDVQQRLDQYAGGHRTWSATVFDGVVEISGAYDDEVERRVVEVLAHSVPGVRSVRQREASSAR
jgi:CBS domain-containing protein